MSKFHFLRSGWALPIAACLACSPEPAQPPNVLIWLVDTLRADHLGCYGYERDTSPVMDGLAAEGLLFENCHSHSNWTQPSVASLLSGCYPPTFDEDFTSTVPDELTMAAEWFREHGYSTGGMTITIATAARYGFDQGFRVYDQLDMYEDAKNRKRREGDSFDAHRLVDAADSWLQHRWVREQPFFLFLHSVDPHAPYNSHAELPTFTTPYDGPVDGSTQALGQARRDGYVYTDRDRQHLLDLYDDEVRYNDMQLGRLLQILEERGVRENTIVVVVSDHGEEFWEHGDLGHGHSNLHSELTHVPLIVSWPAGLQDSARIGGLMRMVDVLPTVIELSGLPALPDADGRSAVAVARGTRELDARSAVFVDRAKQVEDARAVRSEQLLYLTDEVGQEALYDLVEDPGAQHDVRSGHPEQTELMAERLAAWERARASRSEAWSEGREQIEMSAEQRRSLEALGYVGGDGR